MRLVSVVVIGSLGLKSAVADRFLGDVISPAQERGVHSTAAYARRYAMRSLFHRSGLCYGILDLPLNAPEFMSLPRLLG